MTMEIVAHIRTDFPEKFGLPRQSGLVEALKGRVVFTEKYRDANALRGIEGYSHLWLLWEFSSAVREGWSPTVRPPRLGGNVQMGVFATRSPFRPNPIGLSCVRLERVEYGTPEGAVLHVSGIDMADNTPIYDIKPYIAYADSRPDALGGFADNVRGYALRVDEGTLDGRGLSAQEREALIGVLAQDPRPGYRHEDGRVYGFAFAGHEVRFTVKEGCAQVVSITKPL